MVEIKIVVANAVTRKVSVDKKVFADNGSEMNEINEYVYEVLRKNGISKELSIDAASWCELAGFGETYNEDNFDIYVEEV